MGIGEIIKNALKGSPLARKKEKQQCPNCKQPLDLGMERCPNCGVRIKSMFRRKCPKCNSLNELDNDRCTKCRYDFKAEGERDKKTYYLCPICGYHMEGFLTRCPACDTKFI
ncbi:hypothetical protein HZC07_01545 [Candidatus Micrarchaeota archaeon]|nr:hypothetical protein [Candidatus Micrarchaeota archaeon]